MNTKFLILIASFSCILSGNSQSLRAWQKKADEKYAEGKYNTALAYYNTVLDIDSKNPENFVKAGYSAKNNGSFQLAEKYFTEALKSDQITDKAMIRFNLAEIKQKKGSYAEALSLYSEFNNETSSRNEEEVLKTRIFANNQIDACNWALKQEADASVQVIKLDNNVNSSIGEFAPFWTSRGLFYSSVELVKEKPLIRIFLQKENQKGSAIEEVKTKTPANYANVIESNGKIWLVKNENGITNICERVLNEDGSLGRVVEIPEINFSGYSSTQPCVGIGPNNENGLYFVSDRPGGKGKNDIWFAPIAENGSILSPVNIEAVNTEGDEATPYFHYYPKTLVYSSNGVKGFGGFDVFSSVMYGNNFSPAENFGAPINSSGNDLYYKFYPQTGKAYFSSDRPGSASVEGKDCVSSDIYRVDAKIKILANTFNILNLADLAGATVTLFNKTDNRIDSFKINPDGNNFEFGLAFDKEYKLVATKPGFTSDSIEVNTFGIFKPTVLTAKLNLAPAIRLIAETYNGLELTSLNGVYVQLADLENLSNPSNQMKLEDFIFNYPLDFNKKYRLTANKKDFTSDTLYFDTQNIFDNLVINKKLNLIPFSNPYLVSVYFDNDYPDPDMTTLISSQSYPETWKNYYPKKAEFIKEAKRGLNSSEASMMETTLNLFFENQVKLGWDTLQAVTGRLYNSLTKGVKMEILIEGFASPRAANDYNKNLTQRRITSILKYFEEYNNGALFPYIADGSLIVREGPYGEEKSLPGVNDEINRPNLSVYSKSASQERKVKIVMLRQTRGTTPPSSK
jgi:hypothetical protein